MHVFKGKSYCNEVRTICNVAKDIMKTIGKDKILTCRKMLRARSCHFEFNNRGIKSDMNTKSLSLNKPGTRKKASEFIKPSPSKIITMHTMSAKCGQRKRKNMYAATRITTAPLLPHHNTAIPWKKANPATTQRTKIPGIRSLHPGKFNSAAREIVWFLVVLKLICFSYLQICYSLGSINPFVLQTNIPHKILIPVHLSPTNLSVGEFRVLNLFLIMGSDIWRY